MTRFPCGTEHRREALRAAGVVNGIDYVEIRDTEEPVPSLRQRTLFVRLLAPVPAGIGAANVVIDGGERIRTVGVEWAASGTETDPARRGGLTQAEYDALLSGVDDRAEVLVVRTAGRGDFSRYTLRLVRLSGFDPLLVDVPVWFKVECPSDFDCGPGPGPGAGAATVPPIDYLAKDYQGFRRLMLDRLALLAPNWTERNPADVGIALVETLAYVADELSYRQDAVATEAYLGTARSRVSLRRHARLVDYRVHEGRNARAWVRIVVDSPAVALPAGTPLLTSVRNAPTRITPDSSEHRDALAGNPVVFETCRDATLDSDLAVLRFHTWGEPDCILPSGSTNTTVKGAHPALGPGDVLIFATGTKRWAVRLTEVTPATDPSGGLFETPPRPGPVDVTDIAWHPADALPFPLPLTVDGAEASEAWGNIVLADHGTTVRGEKLGVWTGPRFSPTLTRRPLTHAVAPEPPEPASAVPPARAAAPALVVTGTRGTVVERWDVKPDLLATGASETELTVESEHDGTAMIRFGDGEHGRLPFEGTDFTATYRVGNGPAGNVGAESIAHIVTTVSAVTGVSNPLPATGGTAPETAEEIRRDAPHAFAVQERAVTAADYAEVTQRHGQVQRAAATFRWTGSWHTVFVTADRLGGAEVDPVFEGDVRGFLERYRAAGYDVEVDSPVFVPLAVGMHVCVSPEHFRSDVVAAVLTALMDLFQADNFTFAQPVYLSSVYAAVHAVTGVESVDVHTFQRQHQPETSGVDSGVLVMDRLEIARLDNDPNFPERGVFTVTAGGGT